MSFTPRALEPLERRTLLSLLPAGEAFAVHAGPPMLDVMPQTAMDADGDSVVVWESSTGRDPAIMARRYDGDGSPIGEAFRVSSQEHNAVRGDVAMDDAGNFVVVYVELAAGLSGPSVKARRYDADGNALGGVIDVDPGGNPGAGNAGDISVAFSGDGGRFVVAWREAPAVPPTPQLFSGSTVRARAFSGDGTPLGPAFRANASDAAAARNTVDTAMNGDGDFVLTWTDIAPRDMSSDTPPAQKIVARRFDASGNAVGDEFAVTSAEADAAFSLSSVAMDAAGNFVVAWRGGTSVESGGDGYRVFARAYTAAAEPRGGAVTVASLGGGFGSPAVDVAAGDAGGFVVAWRVQRNDGQFRDSHWLFTRQFAADGLPLGDAAFLGQSNHGGLPDVSVAADATGTRALVAWTRDDQAFPERDENVYAVRLAEQDPSTPPPQADFPPAVVSQPDIKVKLNAPDEVIDLGDVFDDDHTPDSDLVYAIQLPPVGSLPPGFAQVTLDPQSPELTIHFLKDAPGDGTITVSAADASGLMTLATIHVTVGAAGARKDVRGAVFADADGNGRRSRHEGGLGGVTVFCDLDGDGAQAPTEPAAVTAADGSYALAVPAGASGVVRASAPAGWRLADGRAGARPLRVGRRGRAAKVPPLAVTGTGSAGGTVFIDANGNGVLDAGEAAPRRARVFVDANGDGAWQRKAERAVKADRAGRFTLTGLPAGVVRLGVIAGRRLSLSTASVGAVELTVPADGAPATSLLALRPTV